MIPRNKIAYHETNTEGLSITIQEPTKFLSDSKSAISIVHDPIQHDRMKQVRIDNFIKSEFENGTFTLHLYIPTLQIECILPG